MDLNDVHAKLAEQKLAEDSGQVYHGIMPEVKANQASDSPLRSPMPVARAGFALGETSQANLKGVIPTLVSVVMLAITNSHQDFCVNEGLRTKERQVKLVAQGFSKTLESMHIPQADGFGHAVDLVPWIQGHPVWDWDGCYKIAQAMTYAAHIMQVAHHIRWGGSWDRRLSDFNSNADYTAAVAAYKSRHVGPDFLDGPHFEWVN